MRKYYSVICFVLLLILICVNKTNGQTPWDYVNQRHIYNTNTGYVGISNTGNPFTPSEQLEVIGNLKLSNGGGLKAEGTSYNLGNFSIGTSDNLGSKLNIYSTDFNKLFIGGSSDYSRISFTDNSQLNSYLDVKCSSDGYFNFSNASGTVVSSLLRINNNGNVGIGTSTPSYILDVNGTINATNFLQNGQALGPWTLSHSNLFYNDGYVGIGTASPTHTLDVNGTINATNILENGQALGQWSVSGNNLYYSNGNVGVGGVNNNSGTALNIYSNNFPLGLNNNTNNYNRIYTSDPGGNSFLEISGGQNGYFNYCGTSLTSSLLKINNNGNVGIGTTNPTHSLEVNGSFTANNYGDVIKLNGYSTGYFLKLDIVGDANWGIEHYGEPLGKMNNKLITKSNDKPSLKNNGKQDIQLNYGMGLRITDNDANAFYIRDNSSGQMRMVINQGNVGIGTTSPAYKLDVNGTINASNIYQNGQQLNLSQWTTSGNNIYYNNSNGKVGIGTSSPVYSLDVNGTVNASNIYQNGQQLNSSQWTTSGSSIYYNSGSVGIGTTNPDPNYKLSVNGDIRTKSIFVETGWPDYVFNNNYELLTLEDLEKYIKENGHLPDIPSNEEVTKNGVNVGDVESKLLKKVEELTLYILKQNKDIEQLKKDNEELKKNKKY